MKQVVCAVFSLLMLPSLAFSGEVAGIVKGYAELPATAKFNAPASATAFRVSGKFTGADSAVAVTTVGSLPGKSSGRLTGLALPMTGQPRQGYSDIQALPGNVAWVLTDNGFGSQANSADAMLVLTQLKMDWASHRVRVVKDVFLRDPFRRMPYPLANKDGNSRRYLSGADLDPESFRWVGSALWIGDEFGPHLVKVDRWGRVLRVFDTVLDGEYVCSPENPAFATCKHQIKRSKGFENLAVLPGDRTLIALLEGPIERNTLKALEFDVRAERWTGKAFDYPLETASNSVGAMTALNTDELLVIERDSLEGTSEFPCKSADDTSGCFPKPAAFKRLYKVTIDRANGRLVKGDYIDLLKLRDPRKITGSKQRNGVYSMPFWTIEAVTRVGRSEVIIANDNNFPSSASRHPNRQDANEFVRVDISTLL